jgi:hypothetical protein
MSDEVVDEKEFFAKDEYTHAEAEIIDPNLVNLLKVNRDEFVQLYAKLIANPYLAPHLVQDLKTNLVNSIAALIEYGIPVDPERKIKSADDVIKEGMMELGGIMGGKLFGGALKAKRAFQDNLGATTPGEKNVFKDPDDGSYYYIDLETGEEVDCDIDGNPIGE